MKTKKKTTQEPKGSKVVIPKVIIPKGRNPVNSNSGNNGQVFELMERKDECQIIAELEGRYLDEFVYTFQQEGKEVTGLSWVGIQEASREMGGIVTKIVKRLEGQVESVKWIEFVVEAKDMMTGSARLGIKRQYNMMRKRAGGFYPVPFYVEIALAKAQRNAIRALLPQTLIKQWIERHRKGSKVSPRAEKADTGATTASEKVSYICSDCQKEITLAEVRWSEGHYNMRLCRQCQSRYRKKT